MKKLIALLTVMVLALAYGLAFADDWPTFTAVQPTAGVSHSSIGKVQGEMIDSLLFADLSRDLPPYGYVAKESGATGAAAGGVRDIGKAQREMIENLLFTDRQKDLP